MCRAFLRLFFPPGLLIGQQLPAKTLIAQNAVNISKAAETPELIILPVKGWVLMVPFGVVLIGVAVEFSLPGVTAYRM